MKLYEEIIFLQHYFKGLFIVENTISYYKPLIEPVKVGRHYIWANFEIFGYNSLASNIRKKNKVSDFDVKLPAQIKNKRQVLRNCVDQKLGEATLKCALLQK